MPMDYSKAWKLFGEHGVTTYQIRKEKIIGENPLQALRSNGDISTKTICKLCKRFNCQPGDLMEYIPDPE